MTNSGVVQREGSSSDEKRFINKSIIGTAYSIAYMKALLERVNAEG
ncbi:hypothetical protein ACFL55_02655 [Candidatus Latescibacterota bacterium]